MPYMTAMAMSDDFFMHDIMISIEPTGLVLSNNFVKTILEISQKIESEKFTSQNHSHLSLYIFIFHLRYIGCRDKF